MWLVCRSPFSRTQRSCNRLLRDRRSTAIRSSIVAHHFTIRTLVRVRNELRCRVETFACPEREIRLQSCADTSLRYFLSLINSVRLLGSMNTAVVRVINKAASRASQSVRKLSDDFSDPSQLCASRLMLSGTYLTASTAR